MSRPGAPAAGLPRGGWRGRVQAVQRRLQAEAAGPLRSLDPERELATSLGELSVLTRWDGGDSEDSDQDGELGHGALQNALARGLADLAEAQLDAFPGNLFWDLDFIAAEIVAQARPLPGVAAKLALLEDRFARMVRLQALYGRGTAINFTYVHDFVYGFDWAKWVAREPGVRARAAESFPGPFSLEFLIYMERRGDELLALIAVDDRKYPGLDEGAPRNPFPFSREPGAEVRLHRELARRDLIPVPTWDAGATALDWSTRWRVPYQARRVEVASELGLSL